MDIETIQTFLKIVNNNSFTKTADEMYCSQAAVSLRMKKLEHYIGAELFHRDNKKLKLTNEGQLFVPYAQQIVDVVKDAKKCIYLSHNINGSTINICSSSTPGTYILPKILYEFRKNYPDVSIVNQVQYTKDVIRDIKENKYSIGFISQPHFSDTENLVCEPIMDDPLSLFVSINHPFAKRDSVRLTELKSSNFLISNPKSSIVEYIERLGDFSFPKANIHIMGHIEAIKQGVIGNMGFSVLSHFSIAKELKYGLIKEVKLVDDLRLNRKIYAISHKEFNLPLADEIFLDYVKGQVGGHKSKKLY